MLRLAGAGLGCVRGLRNVFHDVDFQVSAGEALALTGPNGAGKSTLLRLIAGLLRTSAGHVALEGGTADLTVLPPLTEIFAALGRFLSDGTILDSLGVSMITLGLGMAVSIGLGILIGAMMGRYRTVEYALDVYINAAMAAPMVAFVPVFILVFGIGYPTRVLTVIIFAIFPIIVNTLFGLQSADRGMHDLFTLHHANRVTRLRKLMFPCALPAIFAGLRISAGLSVIGAVVGDFFFGQGDHGSPFGLIEKHCVNFDFPHDSLLIKMDFAHPNPAYRRHYCRLE